MKREGTGKIVIPVMVLSGSVAPAVAGIGIAQALHGHSWGYLLLAAGLAASVPYFVHAARSLRRTARALREVTKYGPETGETS